MNSFHIFTSSIDNAIAGFNSISTFGRIGIFSTPPRSSEFPYLEDIEMNAMTGESLSSSSVSSGPPVYSDRQTNITPLFRPLQIASVIRDLFSIKMPRMQRPRFLRNVGELTQMFITFLLAVFMVYVWPAYGKPLHRFFEPLGIPLGQIYAHNWQHLRNTTSHWLSAPPAHTAVLDASPIYAPGFYIIPADENIPSNQIEGPYATSMLPSIWTSQQTNINELQMSPTAATKLAQRRDADAGGPYHHAYPIHAGSVKNGAQAQRVKSQLERCAQNMLRKLHNQGIETTPGFEFALQDCKSAIDFALDTLFLAEKTVRSGIESSSERMATVQKVPRAQIQIGTQETDPISSKSSKDSEQNSGNGKRSICSRDICDWVSESNLDRCYHRDEGNYQDTGKISYTNDSVDDFKDNAPLECNLCLPSVNQKEIDAHCGDVAAAEKIVVTDLSIALGVMVLATIIGVLLRFCWNKYKKHAPGRNASGLPSQRARTPVMPRARDSSLSVHRRRVHKNLISKPVPIQRPMNMTDDAFENPRAAPSRLSA